MIDLKSTLLAILREHSPVDVLREMADVVCDHQQALGEAEYASAGNAYHQIAWHIDDCSRCLRSPACRDYSGSPLRNHNDP